uniref:Uncharacterized protein n=1 Tax=Cacopsylla melanoneura TaxID=428564 RepID=A0A8D8UW33_9HEMI
MFCLPVVRLHLHQTHSLQALVALPSSSDYSYLAFAFLLTKCPQTKILCLSSFVLCFSMGCPLLLPLHSSHHKTWHLSFSFVLHYGVFHAVLVHPLYLLLVH